MNSYIAMRLALQILACAATIAFSAKTVEFKILAINDFHGQITSGLTVHGRPVGSAPVLATYLEDASRGREGRCFLVESGDLVGASQPECALLDEKPAVALLNYLSAKIPVIGCMGNHELDKGISSLQKLLSGMPASNAPFGQETWKGAKFPVLCANMVDSAAQTPVLLPFVIKTVAGTAVKVAFIGATLRETPSMVSPSGVRHMSFLDEAAAVNRYVSMLRETMGIRAFVVLLHQGGDQLPYEDWTDTLRPLPSADISTLVSRFDDDVDVVCTAHTHNFTNAIVRGSRGHPVLVTQAYSKGTAYAEIECTVDSASRDIVTKKARIVTTWADAGPGLAPDKTIIAMMDSCAQKVLPLTGRVVGFAQTAITRTQNRSGESALGDLIADAQRAAVGSDFALMNPGGIRTDIEAGKITWGNLYSVQPFGNKLISMRLTGQQVYDVLNQQWADRQRPRMLQTRA